TATDESVRADDRLSPLWLNAHRTSMMDTQQWTRRGSGEGTRLGFLHWKPPLYGRLILHLLVVV
ncbi:hypothetical protein PMAYCL1PPCAC_00046, partial [Pristionchus mayeri]